MDDSDHDRPVTGGPATINGITYQMLWCLLRSLQLDDKAALLLEPMGGDLHEISGPLRRVVQLKSRPGGKTWSLREIITDVFPDLYRAADSEFESSYVLVTEGSLGRWRKVYDFFLNLKDREPGDDPVTALDDTKELKFSHGGEPVDGDDAAFWKGPFTERAIFLRIAEHLRTTTAVPKDEPDQRTHQKLWQLLAGFEFVGSQSQANVRKAVISLLLALVDRCEEVQEKARALLQWLADLAARGSTEVLPHDLLKDHGLDVVPLSNSVRLREAGARLYSRQTELRGYQSGMDVRMDRAAELAAEWQSGPPILVLSGESGFGKSWSLFALGQCLLPEPGSVVFIEATGDAERDLQRAADILWQEIAGHDGSISLSRIGSRRAEFFPDWEGPWLTLLVDGLQDTAEAEAIARTPVEDWGVRLAVACPPHVSSVLRAAAGDRARAVQVPPFTAEERNRFLEEHLGDAWAAVPQDVRATLRRPLLASLYCRQVSERRHWQPTDEYELYLEFWRSLSRGKHEQHPFDASRLAKLACTVLENAPYPWRPARLTGVGLDEAALTRLVRSGWLRKTGNDLFEVTHDRLLNFAAAQGFIESLSDNSLPLDQAVGRLRDLLCASSVHSGRHFGYVPMDVLFMALHAPELGQGTATDILAQLDDCPYQVRESLYRNLLPTLGPDVLPILFERLAAAADAAEAFHWQPIVDAIVSFDNEDVRRRAHRLLTAGTPRQQRAACHVLAVRSDPSALDGLWAVHCQMQADPEPFGTDRNWMLYDQSVAALREGCRLNPEWLEAKVVTASAKEPNFSDLGYILASIRDPAIWFRVKPDVIDKTPADKMRAVCRNIGVYRDSDELPLLVSLVAVEEDLTGPMALWALASIDPDLALEQIPHLTESMRYLTRSWFLPLLHELRPEKTKAALRDQIAAADDRLWAARVYQGQEDLMDEETLELLLEAIPEAVTRKLADTDAQSGRLSISLDLLKKVRSPSCLAKFRSKAGTKVARSLADYLAWAGPRKGVWADGTGRGEASTILLRMDSEEFRRVNNAHFSADSRYGRLDAIQWAYRSADDTTVALLLEAVHRDDLWDDFPVLQQDALNALASHGATREVVEGIMLLGLRCSPNLFDHMTAPRPFSDEDMSPALQVLGNGGSETEISAAILACGLSGRSDKAQQIIECAAKFAPQSDAAIATTLTLGRLGTDTPEAIGFLESQCRSGRVPPFAINALWQIGSPDSLSALANELDREFDVNLAVNLAHTEATKAKAIATLQHHLGGTRADASIHAVIQGLAPVDLPRVLRDSGVRDRLRERAFADEHGGWVTGSKAVAIRGLAAFDPDAAFQAAQKVFEDTDAHDRTLYPRILMGLDPGRTVPLLLRQMRRERSSRVLRAIGRAVTGEPAENDILSRLDSASPRDRAAACRIATVLEPAPALIEKLRAKLDDPDSRVTDAALDAIRNVRRSANALQFISQLEAEKELHRRWVLLDCAIDLADHGDLDTPWPGWAERAWQTIPYSMQNYLAQQLKDRREKLAKQLDRQDEKRCD